MGEEESNNEKYYRLVFGVMGMLIILSIILGIIDAWVKSIAK